MPELPEVETVRLGLAPVLAGRRLVRVEARRPDLRFPLPPRFAERLTGRAVERLGRRGKYILAGLSGGETLLVHLGMTGRFEVGAGAAPAGIGAFAHPAPMAAKHAHILFETDAGVALAFHDARRFGFMDIVADDALAADPRLALMGPEPLGPAFDADHLAAAFRGRRQPVKSALLDQRTVAGLGNIYVCEALHRAGISPLKAAGSLSRARLRALAAAVREVLEAAIAAGGSTLRDFSGVEGGAGYFQHDFRVYGRAGEPCATPGCGGLIVRQVQAGRSTFWCPRCQR